MKHAATAACGLRSAAVFDWPLDVRSGRPCLLVVDHSSLGRIRMGLMPHVYMYMPVIKFSYATSPRQVTSTRQVTSHRQLTSVGEVTSVGDVTSTKQFLNFFQPNIFFEILKNSRDVA